MPLLYIDDNIHLDGFTHLYMSLTENRWLMELLYTFAIDASGS
jgi:hypothetical protein